MSTGGRPIRFLLIVAGGWTLLRITLVWNETGSLPQAIDAVNPLPQVAAADRRGTAPSSLSASPVVRRYVEASPKRRTILTEPLPSASPLPEALPFSASDSGAAFALGMLRGEAVMPLAPAQATLERPLFTAPTLHPGRRWQLSAWVVARDGGSTGVAPVSQLGGGQAGIRVDRTIGSELALTGRLTTPLAGQGREAAVGIAWQPRGSALRIVAEQRFALDRGRDGPALGASAGVSDLPLAAGVKLEAYGQAGVIARDEIESYADGAARAFRPLAHLDRAVIDIGAGVWGARQRGAGRLDLGPSIAFRLPFRDGGGARLQIDWRQRVAGQARPGSGPAITLASDF